MPKFLRPTVKQNLIASNVLNRVYGYAIGLADADSNTGALRSWRNCTIIKAR